MATTNTELSLSLLESFKQSKVFNNDRNNIVTSLEYDNTGTLLITGSNSSHIHLYDAISGKPLNKIISRKYGVGILKFTASNKAILQSSIYNDNVIKCLSLHDGNYIRDFRGHSTTINSMMASSVSDFFISSSLNDTVRLWDLSSPTSISYLPIKKNTLVALDPFSLIFAVAISNESIRFYDVKKSTSGPFVYWKDKSFQTSGEWSHIVFSPNGKLLMISTTENEHLILNSFTGERKHIFLNSPKQVGTPKLGNNNEPIYYSDNISDDVKLPSYNKKFTSGFSPDSKYIITTSPSENIFIYELSTGKSIQLKNHFSPVYHARFNPSYLQISSADSSTTFWLPK